MLRGLPVLLGVLLLAAWWPSYRHHYSAELSHRTLATGKTGYQGRGIGVRLQVARGQVAIVATRADEDGGILPPTQGVDAGGWAFHFSNDMWNHKMYGNLGGPGMFAAKAWSHPDTNRSGRPNRSSWGFGLGAPVWFVAALLIAGPAIRRSLLHRWSPKSTIGARPERSRATDVDVAGARSVPTT